MRGLNFRHELHKANRLAIAPTEPSNKSTNKKITKTFYFILFAPCVFFYRRVSSKIVVCTTIVLIAVSVNGLIAKSFDQYVRSSRSAVGLKANTDSVIQDTTSVIRYSLFLGIFLPPIIVRRAITLLAPFLM